MARGRPSIPHNPTKFMNSKKRVIFMTAEGKYVAKSEDGKKVYGPKAHYVKSPGGTVRHVKESDARVPTALRTKAKRAPRSPGQGQGGYGHGRQRSPAQCHPHVN